MRPPCRAPRCYDFLFAFSCKTRYFCPSCHQTRVLLYGGWVEESVLAPVAHRQYVFTIPRLLAPDSIARRRAWLGELCRIAARLLGEAYAEALPGSRPGLILFVQTFGDLVNFHPHVHVLAADGVFRVDGTFLCLPPVPEELLREGFRQAVLDFLVKVRAIPAELRSRLLEWRHFGGFSVHNRVCVAGDDPEGRQKLAGYMLRAPMSLEETTYDARSGSLRIAEPQSHATNRGRGNPDCATVDSGCNRGPRPPAAAIRARCRAPRPSRSERRIPFNESGIFRRYPELDR
jgi:hypothetical protein